MYKVAAIKFIGNGLFGNLILHVYQRKPNLLGGFIIGNQFHRPFGTLADGEKVKKDAQPVGQSGFGLDQFCII